MERDRIEMPFKTKEQLKRENEEFKQAVKEEKALEKKQKEALRQGHAIGETRMRMDASQFRRIQGTKTELANIAREFLVLSHWLQKKFGYDYASAKRLYDEDARKMEARIFKEALKKVK